MLLRTIAPLMLLCAVGFTQAQGMRVNNSGGIPKGGQPSEPQKCLTINEAQAAITANSAPAPHGPIEPVASGFWTMLNPATAGVASYCVRAGAMNLTTQPLPANTPITLQDVRQGADYSYGVEYSKLGQAVPLSHLPQAACGTYLPNPTPPKALQLHKQSWCVSSVELLKRPILRANVQVPANLLGGGVGNQQQAKLAATAPKLAFVSCLVNFAQEPSPTGSNLAQQLGAPAAQCGMSNAGSLNSKGLGTQ
jgi:hypothetical protein